MPDLATGLRHIFFPVITAMALQLPAIAIAQTCDLETMQNCEPKKEEGSKKEWEGPTIRSRLRLYGGYESIKAPEFTNEDSRLNDLYLRRADLTFRGSLLEDVGYYFKAELREADLDIRDIYLSYETDLGLFMLGYIDPIDEAVDPSYREFLESSAMEDFAPGNQLGLGLFREGENWTLFLGATKDRIDKDKIVDAGPVYSVRFTIAPPVPEGYFLHLGGYASVRSLDKDEDLFRYRATSLFRTGDEYVDTGFVADKEELVGMEFGMNIGPTSIDGQCAVIRASVPTSAEHSYIDGCYLAGIWTITGEERYYGGDGFTLLRVKTSVFDGEPGAWQVGARYDTIDLTDGAIQGGGQGTWTYSLNWYLNSKLWLSADYSRTKFTDLPSIAGYSTDGWGVRAHYLIEW